MRDLIPPDRRWMRTLALALVCMAAGAYSQRFVAERDAEEEQYHAPIEARGIGPVALHGPGGDITLPMSTPVVMNVWVQGCQDCMPAFDAYALAMKNGDLDVGVPVLNVAFGEADKAWADRYGVGTNLFFDRTGAAIVRPLGIGTFTTLVLDEQGRVRLVDRPDRRGYADRLHGATRALGRIP